MRTKMLAAGLLATSVLAAVGTGAPVSAGASERTSTSDPSALYRDALATTRAWSVHYASSSTQSGSTLVVTGDAGPASGSQTVSMGDGTISIFVIGGISYVKGNPTGLEKLVGFSASEAAPVAGQWIDFPTNSSVFSSVVVGVRSGDVAKELALHGPLVLGRARTVGGVEVDAIEGTQTFGKTKVRVVLYVRAKGSHVPVEEDSIDKHGRPTAAVHVVYSAWGETVRPQAPRATVTLGPVTAT